MRFAAMQMAVLALGLAIAAAVVFAGLPVVPAPAPGEFVSPSMQRLALAERDEQVIDGVCLTLGSVGSAIAAAGLFWRARRSRGGDATTHP